MLPVIPRKAVIGTYQCTDDEMMLPVIPVVVIGTYQCRDDVSCDPQEML